MLAIHAENLVKKYDSQRVLDGVNLDMPGSESYALTGPNGSGKTTLVRFYTQDSVGSSINQLTTVKADYYDARDVEKLQGK